jgi:NAD+--asparagine ADP-ribosyltransferase
MLNVAQEKIVSLGNAIEELKSQVKEINKEISQFYDEFLEENNLEKKLKKELKGSVSDYLKWKKDSQKFNESETIRNEFLDLLTGEKCI